MKYAVALLFPLWMVSALAQTLQERDTPLDHLAGRWVMTGTIAGQEITHDLEAEWVLDGHYLYFHERARERDENGDPAYESQVYFGWDEAGERLVCLWLDITGGGGLVPDGFGYARPDGDRIPFVWGEGADSQIHNTFTYLRDEDAWAWRIDNVRQGEPSNFAQVVLNRVDLATLADEAGSPERQEILDAIAQLSAATAADGGGADAYGAMLTSGFSRWTIGSDAVEGRETWLAGIRDWFEQGWRVVDRQGRVIDLLVEDDRAFARRIVTETYAAPDGDRSPPATAALDEAWRRIDGQWLLHRVTVHPVME